MKRRLVVYRLKDPFGNNKKLMLTLAEDGVLDYTLSSSWNPGGQLECMSSLGAKETLPLNPSEYMDLEALSYEIENIIQDHSHMTLVEKEFLNKLHVAASDDVETKAAKELTEVLVSLVN